MVKAGVVSSTEVIVEVTYQPCTVPAACGAVLSEFIQHLIFADHGSNRVALPDFAGTMVWLARTYSHLESAVS